MSKSTKSILTSLLLGSVFGVSTLADATQLPPAPQATLPHYVLFDVGTFGGGWGLYSNPGARAVNRHGANVGTASTGQADPFCPDWCFGDGYLDYGFEWRNGKTTNLGALADGYNSLGQTVDGQGLIAGVSQNGETDPDTGAPVIHGVIWSKGKISDLGTLGGTQSATYNMNDAGQIVDDSSTADTNDPFVGVPMANCLWLPNNGTACGQLDFGTNTFFLPVTTQSHAAVWSQGRGLKDIGSLGGPDAAAYDINESGEIVGWSYNSYQAGPSGVPDTRPFIWDKAHGMRDLGSLGGTFGSAMLINTNGEVVGASNLAGDTVVHPFVWDKKHGMHDLGSFGGWYSHPNWINDKGDVVGISSTPDDVRTAFYWHNGVLKNLGLLGAYERSVGVSINNRGLIAGYAWNSDGTSTGIVSDRGGALVDVNTLIDDNQSAAVVLEAYYVNDKGEIVGVAAMPNGDVHPVVLVPDTDADRIAQMKAQFPQTSLRARSGPPASRPVTIHRTPDCRAGRVAARACSER